MKKTFWRVYFDKDEALEIRRRLSTDQTWLKMNEDYKSRMSMLREKEKILEEEWSKARTKAIRRIQNECIKEKQGVAL